MSAVQGRRSFITGLASLAGMAAFERSARPASAQTPPAAPPAGPPPAGTPAAGAPPAGAAPAGAPPPIKWDLSWLDSLKGKHKQVYDYGSFNLEEEMAPLRFITNFLDAHRDVSGIPSSDINTIVGSMVTVLPLNVGDAAWEKYKLGELWKINDPMTKAPAVRNIFLADTPFSQGVKTLQSRGTIFWQCNVALNRVAMTLSQGSGVPPLTVRNDLVAALVPGVRLVPSHVMLVGLVQERGFTYLKP